MFPGGPNPTQVQFVPPGKAHNSPLPLVLIHDGGGTTFSYFVLGSLERDVWAVHNPNYFEGLPWEGGMDEMAKKYLDFIAGELVGPIMLGGKSFFFPFFARSSMALPQQLSPGHRRGSIICGKEMRANSFCPLLDRMVPWGVSVSRHGTSHCRQPRGVSHLSSRASHHRLAVSYCQEQDHGADVQA